MNFALKDIIYVGLIVISAVVTFLTSRYKLKEYVRDKNDELKNRIHELEIKLEKQKSKDDLQQQVIDQIGKQMDELIPTLTNAINKQSKSKK